MTPPKKKTLIVYMLVEKEEIEEAFWVEIGTAFENRDGSINIYLYALPVNGKLQIREKKEETP